MEYNTLKQIKIYILIPEWDRGLNSEADLDIISVENSTSESFIHSILLKNKKNPGILVSWGIQREGEINFITSINSGFLVFTLYGDNLFINFCIFNTFISQIDDARAQQTPKGAELETVVWELYWGSA